MNAPLLWYGGKNRLTNHIIERIPEHNVFVDVFAGSGSMFFAKKPSAVDIYNDINPGSCAFYRVIQSPNKWKKLQDKLRFSPYSRELFDATVKFYDDMLSGKRPMDEFLLAYCTFIKSRQSFLGDAKSWGYSRTTSMPESYYHHIEKFEEYHQIFRRVLVENLDYRELMKKYDKDDVFFYMDPPYVNEKLGRVPPYHGKPWTIDDHKEMIDFVLNIKGKVLISGHHHEVYDKLTDNGWIAESIDMVVQVYDGQNKECKTKEKGHRDKYFWRNYELPTDGPTLFEL